MLITERFVYTGTDTERGIERKKKKRDICTCWYTLVHTHWLTLVHPIRLPHTCIHLFSHLYTHWYTHVHTVKMFAHLYTLVHASHGHLPSAPSTHHGTGTCFQVNYTLSAQHQYMCTTLSCAPQAYLARVHATRDPKHPAPTYALVHAFR